jgi:hypothetical protein
LDAVLISLMRAKRSANLILLHPIIIKVKLSRYTPWRHMGGKEVWLLLILNLGTRWGWVVSSRPGRALPPGKGPPVPIG